MEQMNDWQVITIGVLGGALMLGIAIILLQHSTLKEWKKENEEWREVFGETFLSDIQNESK